MKKNITKNLILTFPLWSTLLNGCGDQSYSDRGLSIVGTTKPSASAVKAVEAAVVAAPDPDDVGYYNSVASWTSGTALALADTRPLMCVVEICATQFAEPYDDIPNGCLDGTKWVEMLSATRYDVASMQIAIDRASTWAKVKEAVNTALESSDCAADEKMVVFSGYVLKADDASLALATVGDLALLPSNPTLTFSLSELTGTATASFWSAVTCSNADGVCSLKSVDGYDIVGASLPNYLAKVRVCLEGDKDAQKCLSENQDALEPVDLTATTTTVAGAVTTTSLAGSVTTTSVSQSVTTTTSVTGSTQAGSSTTTTVGGGGSTMMPTSTTTTTAPGGGSSTMMSTSTSTSTTYPGGMGSIVDTTTTSTTAIMYGGSTL